MVWPLLLLPFAAFPLRNLPRRYRYPGSVPLPQQQHRQPPVSNQNAWLLNQIEGYDTSSTRQANVAGADLGIGFEFKGEFFLLFGDTFGVGSNFSVDTGARLDWRSNTLARTKISRHKKQLHLVADEWNYDTDNKTRARQLLHAAHVFPDPVQPNARPTEVTVIPTAAWADHKTVYVWYMSVRHFDGDAWTCNNASVATAQASHGHHSHGHNNPLATSEFTKHDDINWQPDPYNLNLPLMFAVVNWKGMGHRTPKHLSECPVDPTSIYLMATPCGRTGPASLLKVPSDQLLNKAEYLYFGGVDHFGVPRWHRDAGSAKPVLPSFVGELSVMWVPSVRRWVALYTAPDRHPVTRACGIVARISTCLWSGWSEERLVLANGTDSDIAYGGFTHPALHDDSTDDLLYFTASLHFRYNTYLAAVDLKKVFHEELA